MKKSKITENSYVMNTYTGKAYKVTTNTIQSRNRRELIGTGIRNPEITRTAESRLHALTHDEAKLCMDAERLIRGRHKRSVKDKALLRKWHALRNSIVK